MRDISRRSVPRVLVGLLAVTATVFVAAQPAAAVVGGTVVNPADYPYFVKIVVSNADGQRFLCGGSIIADSMVLTAAHCAAVAAGGGHIRVTVTGHGEYTATQSQIHPLFNGDWADGHDLALVWLPPGATAGIGPPQVGAPFNWYAYADGTAAKIMGYGRISTNGSDSPDLRVADTVLRSDGYMDDIFNPWYWYDNWKESLMIGAGSADRTDCLGDSGGPLMSVGYARQIQVGVYSFDYASPFDDGCDNAGGFAELSGPQLAWVAAQVPSIVAGWGQCTTPTGAPGQTGVGFSSSAFPGAQQDGSYYWNIWCIGPPPTVTVPDLLGDTVSQAANALDPLGLHVGSVSVTPDDLYCNYIGKVKIQSISAGTPVARGSAIDITLGQRPKEPCF